MEKRDQVFVSSTYADLKGERTEVFQALLELECFPAGMEMFPAISGDAWELIKRVIDDSDYYCLIIGGRYGSTDADGVGFTEKEYDYAVSRKKPLIAFLHGNPGSIPMSSVEKTDQGRAKLDLFRAKVEAVHHCKYWSTAEDLGGKISRSLVNLRRAHPAEGWIRGKFANDPALQLENANLRARVAELENALKSAHTTAGKSEAFELSQGDDTIAPEINFTPMGKSKSDTVEVKTTWNGILKYVGPTLLNECSEEEFVSKLELCFYHGVLDTEKGKTADHSSIILSYVLIDAIKLQLRALGYMEPGTKRRAVSDGKPYWRLTPEGEAQLIRAQAMKRNAQLPLPVIDAGNIGKAESEVSPSPEDAAPV